MHDEHNPNQDVAPSDAKDATVPDHSEREAANAGMLPRIPTEAMLNAARDWSVKKYGIGVGNDDATGCWQSMYDATIAAGQEAANAKDAAELRLAICNIPLPVYGSNSFQHGFDAAREAVLALLSKRAAMAAAPSSEKGGDK